MPFTFEGQLTVEKSPSYFITPEAPKRVYKMNSSAKLLLIVRDPVVRLLSDFAQIEATRSEWKKKPRSFEDVALLSNGSVNFQYKAIQVFFHINFLLCMINCLAATARKKKHYSQINKSYFVRG